jgi:hypothetical protein
LAINSQPQFAEPALILGDSPLAASLLLELESRPELWLRVMGHILAAGNGTNELNCERRESTDDPLRTVASEEL